MSLGPIALLPLAQAGYGAGAVGADDVLEPTLLLILCVVAGVGTWMLLPGRNRGSAMRGLGGTLILLSGLVLGLLVVGYTVKYSAGGAGIYFWIFSAVAVLGALRVVTHPRPVYSALYFVLTVFATAGLFILLWAEFMAAALVIIYAGAILVTYVFVIMLAASTVHHGVEKLAEYDSHSRDPIVASAVGFALMGLMLFVIFDRGQQLPPAPTHAYTFTGTKAVQGERRVEVQGEVSAPSPAAAKEMIPADVVPDPNRLPEPAFSMAALGRYLFRDQAIGLELSGLILTLGMVGAILIARRRVVHPADARLPAGISRPRETFTAPATPISDDPYSIPVYGTDNPAQKAYPET
jgi:NADH-quinone oxidoreductase subunit J